MPFKYANRVQMTITNSPGTNAGLGLNLGSATSGYQTFAAAGFSADDTTDILITQGTAWEICKNCRMMTTTSITRSDLEASSAGTGNRASFTAGAVVSVIPPASRGNAWTLPTTDYVSLTSSDHTGQLNALTYLDLTGLTASRAFFLPESNVSVGDRVGCVVAAISTTHVLYLKGLTAATTIRGANYDIGIGWSQLFLPYDTIVFRCISADPTAPAYEWIVEYDGRTFAPVAVENNGTTTQSFSASGIEKVAAALTTISSPFGDEGGQWLSGSKRFQPKRAGYYMCGGGVSFSSLDVNSSYRLFLYKNGAVERMLYSGYVTTAGGTSQASGSALVYLNGDTDYVELFAQHTSATAKATEASAKRTFFNAHWVGQFG